MPPCVSLLSTSVHLAQFSLYPYAGGLFLANVSGYCMLFSDSLISDFCTYWHNIARVVDGLIGRVGRRSIMSYTFSMVDRSNDHASLLKSLHIILSRIGIIGVCSTPPQQYVLLFNVPSTNTKKSSESYSIPYYETDGWVCAVCVYSLVVHQVYYANTNKDYLHVTRTCSLKRWTGHWTQQNAITSFRWPPAWSTDCGRDGVVE